MKLPRVYPILDSQTLEARGMGLAVAAAAFLEGGAEILQIRHKGHWGTGRPSSSPATASSRTAMPARWPRPATAPRWA